MNVHILYVLEEKTSKKNPCVCLSVWLYVRTWILAVGTITLKGVSGSNQNLVGVFYVWNVGLVLKSKVKPWSWSWTGFWFSQKLCGTTPNLSVVFRTQSITFVIDFDHEILILILIMKKKIWKNVVEQNWISCNM